MTETIAEHQIEKKHFQERPFDKQNIAIAALRGDFEFLPDWPEQTGGSRPEDTMGRDD